MIQLSVVIPTYNRGGKILSTLNSLAKQTFREFEVVVINDGSTDNTATVLDAIDKDKYSFQITIIHQENQGRAGVRNSGFNRVKAELIVSIDDDMRLDERCLEEHFNHHQLHPGSILVGVQQEDPRMAKTDIQKFLAHQRVSWLEGLEKADNPMKPDQIYITAANFSISKSTFNKIGGFDPRLKAVVDYDLAMRATELGIPIYYNNKAIGWHDDFITCRSFIKRRKQGVENEKLLMQLKPDLVGKYHRYKDTPPSQWKMFVYSILANKSFVKRIDDSSFFVYLLPKSLRYKFYAAVIMAFGKYFPEREI
jgi:glycosyltransferase involved in cell wall biosynthesis